MKIRLNRSLAFIIIIFGSAITFTQNFIFDLGGVLIDTHKIASLRHMGPLNIAQYSLQLKISPFALHNQIKSVLFEILEQTADFHDLHKNNSLHLACDENGTLLPYLMRAWLQGTMTCAEIRSLIHETTIQNTGWFKNKAEQRIFTNMVNMIFTPEHFVSTRKIDPAGLEFIKKCKKHGHNVYALSNWDAESFQLLKAKHADLFDLFDGIVISGTTNCLKPHPSIYHTLLQEYKLKADDCWFIDDQQENVNAAQSLGINAVVHTACFKKLVENIQIAIYSKSLTLRKDLNIMGINVSNTNPTSNAIIEGENISPGDSTK